MVFRGCVVAALLLVPAALADSLDAPLPPTFVEADATSAGVSLSWLPPADDGGHPITAYWIERLHPDATLPTWVHIATTDGQTFTFLDIAAAGTTAYRVIAVNEGGPSFPSTPTAATSANGGGVGNSIGEVQVLNMKGEFCDPMIAHLPNPQPDWDCVWGILR
jgi:hypothetical protein